MNYNYYQQPFMGMPYGQFQQPIYPQFVYADNLAADQQGNNQYSQQSYIENILRLNIGKVANVYMNFEGSQWGTKIFKGTLLAAGKDHIILKDIQSDVRYVLLSVYLCYVTFDEVINYEYPYAKKEQ